LSKLRRVKNVLFMGLAARRGVGHDDKPAKRKHSVGLDAF